jgi:phosphoribosylglycinamide formyltransferase 1
VSPRPLPVPTDRPLRVAVLVSGGGTTLLNFVKERAAGRLPIDIPLVIASRPDCGGIQRAAAAAIPCEVVARKAFRDRVLNIHPSLIPAFSGHGFHGHHVHEAVIARGACVSGCTVHLADNEYDHGPILLQRVVPVLEDDTPDRLARRVFAAECEAYPEALRRIATGQLVVAGPRVVRRA